MKKFFSLVSYKQLKLLLFLEALILILGLVLTRHMHLNYFNFSALIISIIIYGFCVLLDKKTYFDFFTLIATVFFTYEINWFIFTFLIK